MPNYFQFCSDRIREFFMSSDMLSSQDLPFLERFYAHHWPVLRKLKIGECEDVYLSASTRDHRFNSNIKAHLGVLDEMSWGYKGTGSYTLALNILYTFTADAEFAKTYALEFRSEFLEKIDSKKNYWMPNWMILNWINEKLNGEKINE